MDLENNIPAFPIVLSEGQNYNRQLPHDGMTLLDYFAAKALNGFLSNPVESTKLDSMHMLNADQCKLIACGAYLQAAAMLEERTKYIK